MAAVMGWTWQEVAGAACSRQNGPKAKKAATQTRRRLTSLVATREVWLGSITDSPTAQWLEEILRKEIAKENGFLKGVSYLIHDRGTIYGGRVHKILKEAGIRGKWLPVRSQELNAFMESCVKSFKRECADHIVFTSAGQLEYCTREYLEWYNHERPHRGLGGRMIHPWPQAPDGEIVEFSRLGGLLKSYRRVKLAA